MFVCGVSGATKSEFEIYSNPRGDGYVWKNKQRSAIFVHTDKIKAIFIRRYQSAYLSKTTILLSKGESSTTSVSQCCL